jgi:flagellin-specific chaperone FliS
MSFKQWRLKRKLARLDRLIEKDTKIIKFLQVCLKQHKLARLDGLIEKDTKIIKFLQVCLKQHKKEKEVLTNGAYSNS